MSYEFIDLFCGAGLFTQGMKEAGHIPIAGYDKWPLAIKSYNVNHSKRGVLCDLGSYPLKDFPNVDVVIGSPPCQEFSLNNNGATRDTVLINRFLEVIEQIKPKYWIMEEVPLVAKYVNLKKYSVHFYDASNFGANQKRKRLFAGHYNPVLVPGERRHKVSSLTGYIARQKFSNHKEGVSNKAGQIILEYFNFENPTIPRLKTEFGLPRSYKLKGTYNQQVTQIINGVYVPLIKKLGENL